MSESTLSRVLALETVWLERTLSQDMVVSAMHTKMQQLGGWNDQILVFLCTLLMSSKM